MKMATREFVFEVRYGGHIDRRFMNSYVGGDVDVYTDAIPHDRVSFSVVEDIAKRYRYKSGDLIYYLLPGCTLRNGLKLITSNFDVNEMVQAHLGLPIVELYINSFSGSIPNIDEGNDEDDNDNDNDNDNDDDDDERGYSRIERDDPYWEEVNEPDLFVDNDDVPGPSMGRGAKRAIKVMRVKRKVMKTKVG
jgi:hypothetical protein